MYTIDDTLKKVLEVVEGSFKMKVFVVGANGKVSRHFADFVKEDESIEEIAMIRKAEQQSFLKSVELKQHTWIW